MGASANNIVMLLSKEFVMLVIIAFILASPVAWYSAKHWLQGFAYQNGVSIFLFVITMVVAIAIAFLTVSYKTIQAANSNPIDSLRTE
jgi:putative ABC transport system permease protein